MFTVVRTGMVCAAVDVIGRHVTQFLTNHVYALNVVVL